MKRVLSSGLFATKVEALQPKYFCITFYFQEWKTDVWFDICNRIKDSNECTSRHRLYLYIKKYIFKYLAATVDRKFEETLCWITIIVFRVKCFLLFGLLLLFISLCQYSRFQIRESERKIHLHYTVAVFGQCSFLIAYQISLPFFFFFFFSIDIQHICSSDRKRTWIIFKFCDCQVFHSMQ